MRWEMSVVYLKLVHALFICYLFDHPIHDAAKPTFLEAFSHVSRSNTTTTFVCSFAKILLVALLIHVKTFDICSSDPSEVVGIAQQQ